MSNKIDINATFTQDDEPSILQPDMILSGKYRLIKQVGKGAMGVVWQADDGNRMVALKFVPKEFEELERFDKELERMQKSFRKIHSLNHQSICPIYDLVKDDEFGYFLVMKFLEGETLDDYKYKYRQAHIGKDKGIPLDQVLKLIKPIAQALDYAHNNEVIHRDIKPANIFLSETSKGVEIQIIDFGLADEIREGLSSISLSSQKFDKSGTQAYMAPEQWQGHLQTAATDQYALAVIVYELLAGHLPFSGSNIKNAVLGSAPEPIRGISDSANDALLRALAKKRDERFVTCQEFVDALEGAEVKTSRKKTAAAPGIEPLMKRGYQALEDSEWSKASGFFDNVLNIDAEYAPAFIGLLCVELKVEKEELLGDHEKPLADFRPFQRALQYADADYRAVVQGYDEKIRERQLQEKYDRLVQAKNKASAEQEYQDLVGQFREMHGYKDTAGLADECDHQYRKLKEHREKEERQRQEQYDQLVREKNESSTEEEFQDLAQRFRAMNGYKDTVKFRYSPIPPICPPSPSMLRLLSSVLHT